MKEYKIALYPGDGKLPTVPARSRAIPVMEVGWAVKGR